MIDFKLDPKSGVPFYRQIIDQIRYGIVSGRLQVGEQLPTVRGLAVLLKVNLNTVSKAYKELEIKDVLETQQGTGTYISNVPVKIPQGERKNKLGNICREFLTIAGTYGFTSQELISELNRMEI
ncbi:GntR family transcriptional regulator [bacterium]|nr:GntR family transcriptional regulator [bacterium]